MDHERAIGRLEEGVSSLKDDMRELRDDVKLILTWRWKMYGVTATIAIIAGGLFQILIAFLKGI